jgi:hypothetical protein
MVNGRRQSLSLDELKRRGDEAMAAAQAAITDAQQIRDESREFHEALHRQHVGQDHLYMPVRSFTRTPSP